MYVCTYIYTNVRTYAGVGMQVVMLCAGPAFVRLDRSDTTGLSFKGDSHVANFLTTVSVTSRKVFGTDILFKC
jgi:hypothetical protein